VSSEKWKQSLKTYSREGLTPEDTATNAAIRHIVDETDRRVEEGMQQEMAALRAEQVETERAFLSRDSRDRDMATMLMAFSDQASVQPDPSLAHGLDKLIRATKVRVFPPPALASCVTDFPRSRGGCVKFSEGPCSPAPRDQTTQDIYLAT
jgi:hypothetical protein